MIRSLAGRYFIAQLQLQNQIVSARGQILGPVGDDPMSAPFYLCKVFCDADPESDLPALPVEMVFALPMLVSVPLYDDEAVWDCYWRELKTRNAKARARQAEARRREEEERRRHTDTVERRNGSVVEQLREMIKTNRARAIEQANELGYDVMIFDPIDEDGTPQPPKDAQE